MSQTLLPALVADIGGTNARFVLVDREGQLGDPIVFRIADYPTIEDALASHVLPLLAERPSAVLLAAAGVVAGDFFKLTNGHWMFSPGEVLRRLGLGNLILFNDFEALSLALPALETKDLLHLGGGAEPTTGPKLVIGAGTGLGVGALMPDGRRWMPIATEGGHVSFGPNGSDEVEVWRYLWRDADRISAEAILSGPGLVRLYRAVSAVHGVDAGDARAPAIVANGLAATDAVADETLAIFSRSLGRYAGDAALLFLARGGVYLGGGVCYHLADRLNDGTFFRAFTDKAPHHEFLRRIPANLIVNPTPALKGLAGFASNPEQFAVSLAGRSWG